MSRREVVLAPVDVDLLAAVGRGLSLAEACRQLGVSRDRGTYRVRRMSKATGSAVVGSRRGGVAHGVTMLTPAGRALLRQGAGASVPGTSEPGGAPAVLHGTWSAGPPVQIRVAGGLELAVAFVAEEGENVRVGLDPESVLVALGRFPTSARNVLDGVVVRVARTGPGTGTISRIVEVRVGRSVIRASVTDGAIANLGLRRGRRVVLYLKATALRRLDRPRRPATRGSLRS